ncbi:YbaB/EbfC family nucleoid-associated protein [Nocardia sp. NPDC051570]|uniref:YbaB/EbfC family nucleoid-associated protein n=1 Tax=Nocardia sp. NPDC051570 TaxID=3364324 RepID=UPI00379F567C
MSDHEFAAEIGELSAELAEITRLQQQRTTLMGVGATERRRVTVTVNADGIAIDIRFSPDIGDLDYDEIAAAVTEASQLAVADVARQTAALFEPITPDRTASITIDDTLAGIAYLRDQLR